MIKRDWVSIVMQLASGWGVEEQASHGSCSLLGACGRRSLSRSTSGRLHTKSSSQWYHQCSPTDVSWGSHLSCRPRTQTIPTLWAPLCCLPSTSTGQSFWSKWGASCILGFWSHSRCWRLARKGFCRGILRNSTKSCSSQLGHRSLGRLPTQQSIQGCG